jgi:dipeptidyl aminopeptidase/acylaminoacyl peptidase
VEKRLLCLVAATAHVLAGCEPGQNQPVAPQTPPRQATLAEARQGFTTKLIRKETANEAVPHPPPALFRSVNYGSPLGNMAAYLSASPGDGHKHPAMIWIVGGFGNSVSEIAWEPGPPENDQSASTFRMAGIVMMYPSLRGGNKNPGFSEGFYGEVDDVLAAAAFLETQEYVDPKRIYLGGHSTGGTLALLVAECSDRFRAVFAFGPVGDVSGYGQDHLPFRVSDRREVELRAPARWLHAIRNPTFVFEGTGRGNIGELNSMLRISRNALIHFHPVKGGDHFSILAPISRLIAAKIVADNNSPPNIVFGENELTAALRK